MLNFYKNNMRLIHKFVLNQIAMSLFGFMVIIAMSAFDTDGSHIFELIATAFAAAFFLSLTYDNAWDAGAHDRNKITNNRMLFKPLFGTKIAAFAYLPTALFVLIGLLVSLFSAFGVSFLNGVGFACNTVAAFVCHGMYLGVTALIAKTSLYALCLAALMLPAIAVYTLGYYLGAKDKQIKTIFFGAAPSTDYIPPKKKK